MSLFEDNYIVLTTKNAIAVICLISQLAIVSIICAPATADYTGLNSVVTSDIDIDGIMYQSVDLYVGLTDPNDSIWAVISEDDSPLILSAPNGGLYQSPLGGSTPHDVALDDLFGDMLRYDSFVTIGSNSTEPCCTMDPVVGSRVPLKDRFHRSCRYLRGCAPCCFRPSPSGCSSSWCSS